MYSRFRLKQPEEVSSRSAPFPPFKSFYTRPCSKQGSLFLLLSLSHTLHHCPLIIRCLADASAHTHTPPTQQINLSASYLPCLNVQSWSETVFVCAGPCANAFQLCNLKMNRVHNTCACLYRCIYVCVCAYLCVCFCCPPFIQSTTWLVLHLLTGSITSAIEETLRLLSVARKQWRYPQNKALWGGYTSRPPPLPSLSNFLRSQVTTFFYFLLCPSLVLVPLPQYQPCVVSR